MTDPNPQIEELQQLLQERDRELEHKNRELAEANRLLMRKLGKTVEPRQYQNLENIETSAHHLLNLINDILDLSKVESGRIDIFVEEVDLRRLATECLAAVAPNVGEGVAIAVADTGIGIPAADLPHIFDEFRQVARKGRNAEQGTGLGLAIVKRSIELLSGSVETESAEGKGTTFTLRLQDSEAREVTP